MPGLLTFKQLWRRQNPVDRRKSHDLVYQEGIPMTSGSGRSFSEQAIATEGPPMQNNMNRLWATTGNLQEHKQDLFGNKLRPVMFSARVHVILVPSITDYENAGLTNDLWWKDEDYTQFKQSALKEVKNFMIEKSISNSKDAIKILYQNMDSDDLERVAAEVDQGITAEQSIRASQIEASMQEKRRKEQQQQQKPLEAPSSGGAEPSPISLDLNAINASIRLQTTTSTPSGKVEKKEETFIMKPEAAINAEVNKLKPVYLISIAN